MLLGSGFSKAAGIPIGWEVVLDLPKKLALLRGVSPKPEDLETWYQKDTGSDPSYSDLLAALAKTSAKRQQLLRSCWEGEREAGKKQPTKAHHAIANLVQQGFDKAIVTTIFDRLMERALGQAGIVPAFLSTKEQVNGSIPLTHLECWVFKVHVDFLDPYILNTPDE